MKGKMRSVQVSKPNSPLEMVGRDIPEPGARQVRIKVQACGICHSDSVMKEGSLPGIEYPRVPGHEIAGVIDAIGKEVIEWKIGQRVGVGRHGGHCGHRILSTWGLRLLSIRPSTGYVLRRRLY